MLQVCIKLTRFGSISNGTFSLANMLNGQSRALVNQCIHTMLPISQRYYAPHPHEVAKPLSLRL